MEYYFQGTCGKMIFKLKVISNKREKPDFLPTLYRNLGKTISALPLFYGYLRILAPHQLQTMHDEFSLCYVVEVKQ